MVRRIYQDQPILHDITQVHLLEQQSELRFQGNPTQIDGDLVGEKLVFCNTEFVKWDWIEVNRQASFGQAWFLH